MAVPVYVYVTIGYLNHRHTIHNVTYYQLEANGNPPDYTGNQILLTCYSHQILKLSLIEATKYGWQRAHKSLVFVSICNLLFTLVMRHSILFIFTFNKPKSTMYHEKLNFKNIRQSHINTPAARKIVAHRNNV